MREIIYIEKKSYSITCIVKLSMRNDTKFNKKYYKRSYCSQTKNFNLLTTIILHITY